MTTEISLFDSKNKPVGIGRIWESNGKFNWAHPNGSEGCDCVSFEEAEKQLNEATSEGAL